MSMNNPTIYNPLAYCNYSLDLRDPFFTCIGCYGGENTTILDGTILFTFFAVNGAGNGDATTFTYTVPKGTESG